MKKFVLLLLGLITFVIINAQTTKTFTVIVKDFSEECGQDSGDAIFCLTDENGSAIKERYSCLFSNGEWQVTPQDLITKDWVLNPKYKGKKATLYCSEGSGGAGWTVQKAEFAGISSTSNNSITTADNEPKVITGIITVSEKGMGKQINIQKEMDSPDIESYMIGRLDYESGKYLIGLYKLKPEFEGKKFTVTCIKAGADYIVNKIRLVGEGQVPLEKDNFKTATCWVYNIEGKLVAIVDNNTIYSVKNGIKVEQQSKMIQNKDEICVKDNQCVKVKVEPDGNVHFYKLPNITEKTATLKIVNNRIYRTLKDKGGEIDEYKEFYIFKGNKTQVALVACLARMGMGH
jgi:hypothetical protein